MRSANGRSRAGFTLVELLVSIAIILIILTIAVPMVQYAKLNADETAVIREVQTIHQAQMQYQSQFGKYAIKLSELGPPDQGASGPQAASLIPRSLARGEKNGYVFSMTPAASGYTVTAVPKTFGRTGRRTFYIDQDGIVHQNWGREPATESSPEAQ
jgi:type IV pilus assembly protein PilA